MFTYNPTDGSYTSRIPAGMTAFREEVAEFFKFTRTEVIRDKDRCAQQASEHCECRGLDLYTRDLVFGRNVFGWAVAHADELGIQSVIFDRRVWGFGEWTERPYHGANPHLDHVHIGLTKHAAQHLTRGQVRAALDGTQEDDVMQLQRVGDTATVLCAGRSVLRVTVDQAAECYVATFDHRKPAGQRLLQWSPSWRAVGQGVTEFGLDPRATFARVTLSSGGPGRVDVA